MGYRTASLGTLRRERGKWEDSVDVVLAQSAMRQVTPQERISPEIS